MIGQMYSLVNDQRHGVTTFQSFDPKQNELCSGINHLSGAFANESKTAGLQQTRYEQMYVHVTWKTRLLSESDRERLKSWELLNPGWSVKLYDDQDAAAWINSHTNVKVRSAYHQLTSGPAKADLFRYSILYKEGGAYVDVDCRCIASGCLDTAIKDVDLVTARDPVRCGKAKNAFQAFIVVARSGLDILKQARDHVADCVFRKMHKQDIFSLSGPLMFGNLIRDNGDRYSLRLGVTDGKSTKIRLLEHKVKPADTIIDKNGHVLVSCQERVIGRKASPYGSMWKLRPRLIIPVTLSQRTYALSEPVWGGHASHGDLIITISDSHASWTGGIKELCLYPFEGWEDMLHSEKSPADTHLLEWYN